jgi:hypothetical protein
MGMDHFAVPLDGGKNHLPRGSEIAKIEQILRPFGIVLTE